MTRKHYESIAANFAWQNRIIQEYVLEGHNVTLPIRVLRNLATDMCATFRTDNPRFNSEKFMTAAGF